MPLQKEKDFGTNASGNKSKEYCFHCFQNGKFLDEGITLQEKINKNVKFAVQMGISEHKARKMASNVLPKLKRWKKQSGKMTEKTINPFWFGSKFLEYCVKQGWLKQEGSGGRGTKWYPTDKGRKELKEKFGIEV
jgi:hypothetical protein